ncbi:carbohydrate-binding protein [Natrinema halophilum]|uniref:Chitin-binding type-3 domain-containing protein n=1 Tax=Natrinema halophilum TaxID=1699371 RepID=A0A7D5GNW4_9EURY|nr:carbohydrate-binding protein [Natrinema halophilum]
MTRDDSDTGSLGGRRIDKRTQQLTKNHNDRAALERDDDGGASSHGSRRRFLQVGATALAATAIGTSSVAAQAADEACGSHDELVVGGGDFVLKNNDWGGDVDMCIRTNTDGSYGYEWATRTTGGQPNYPQVLLGTKPWGSDTGVQDFPVRRGGVDQLELEVDVDINISGGKWNLAEEWWLMDSPVSEQTETHTHEIMLVLDWGEGFTNGSVEEANVWTDTFGNTIDYWSAHSAGGTSADFHIFRVQGGLSSGRVDLKPVIDFMSERHGVGGQKWISGIELGNEYWQGSQGDVTYHQCDVTINGTTYTSGGGSGGGNNGGGRNGGDETDPGNEDGDTGNGNEDGDTGNGNEDGDTGNGNEDGDTGNGGENGNQNDDGQNDNGGSDGSESYPAWDPNQVYLEGDRVVHDGAVWEAQWWAQGEEPKDEQWYVWKRVEDADGAPSTEPDTGSTPAWDSSKIYREGDRVTHDGTTWEAQWWTQGQEPRNEAWYVWQPVE